MVFSIRHNTIRIEKSKVRGRGVFANFDFKKGDYLGMIFKKISNTGNPDKDYFRTAMGRYINHSRNPNSRVIILENNRYGIVANKSITNGEEIFIDYSEVAKITGIKFKPFSKRAGISVPPPMMVKQIWEWVLPRYASLVYNTTKDIKLKETAGNDCNFTIYDDYTTTIPISLKGWEYEDQFNVSGELKISIYVSDSPPYGEYYDNSIDIIFDKKWFNPQYNQYNNIKRTIYGVIEHELIHFGQDLFGSFNLKEMGKEHSLQDIEFYTIINDAKTELQTWIQKWPDMKNKIFDMYVGLTPSYSKERSEARQFFENLKNNNPDKWEKAVEELRKRIGV